MIRLAMLLFCACVMLASPDMAPAQQPPAPPAPPASGAPPAPAAPLPPEPYATAFTMLEGGNFLGVRAEEVTRENMGAYGLSGEPRGVGVREVVKGSPAERAGLRERDVILRFDGEAVTSVRKLTRLIEESAPEHAARLTILRGGSQQEVAATLGRGRGFGLEGARLIAPDAEAARRWSEEWRRQGEEWQQRGEEMRRRLEEAQRNNPEGWAFATAFAGRRIGVSTSPLGKQLADYFGVQHGVLINSVEDKSPADRAGLKAGDVVIEAEGERVDDAGDLSRLLNRREDGEVTLTIVRDKQRRTVRVTPERRQPGAFQFTPGAVPRVSIAPRPTPAPRVRPARPRIIRGGNVI